MEKGMFGKGLKQGRWTTWYPDGMYKMVCVYKDGKRNGPCMMYDTSGILRKQLHFKNDFENRNVKEFDEKGTRITRMDSAKVKRKRQQDQKSLCALIYHDPFNYSDCYALFVVVLYVIYQQGLFNRSQQRNIDQESRISSNTHARS